MAKDRYTDPLVLALGALAGLVIAYFALRKVNEVVALLPIEPRSEPLTLPNTKQSFASSLRAAMPNVSYEVATLAVAQAAYESGWGKAVAYSKANNPWNVIVGGGYDYGGYSSHFAPVPGPDRDANNQPITQQWRHFVDFASAARDWFGMLKTLWPTAYAKLMAGDSTYVTDLGNGNRKYYGLTPAVYQSKYDAYLAEVRAL